MYGGGVWKGVQKLQILLDVYPTRERQRWRRKEGVEQPCEETPPPHGKQFSDPPFTSGRFSGKDIGKNTLKTPWKHPENILKHPENTLKTPWKYPENSWRVAFQGGFFAFRTTFSLIWRLFFGDFFIKNPRPFLKSHRFCRTEGLRKPKRARHSLFFQWCPKSLIVPIFKAYERKWPKTLSGKNARVFFYELKRPKT